MAIITLYEQYVKKFNTLQGFFLEKYTIRDHYNQ